MLLRLQNAFASMTEMIRSQERTANNLANANTVGYKRDRAFTEALNEELNIEGAPQSLRQTTDWSDLAPGALEQTGNPLDVALQGDGFFALSDELTGAQRYSRAGRFMLDAEGLLRNAQGYLVEGESGPIQVPPEAGPIEIAADGEVRAGDQLLGRIRVVTFEDPLALARLDGSAFAAGGMEPQEVAEPVLRQGFIESSNVDALKEMTDMITHFRLFEAQQKTIQTTDQVLGNIARDLGRF